jgi:hypothetical protein
VQLRGRRHPSRHVAPRSRPGARATAFLRLVEENDARADLLAPLAGWLTLATAANAQSTWKLPALPLVAGVVAAAAVVLTRSRGNRAYASAVLWGLGGAAWRALRRP